MNNFNREELIEQIEEGKAEAKGVAQRLINWVIWGDPNKKYDIKNEESF